MGFFKTIIILDYSSFYGVGVCLFLNDNYTGLFQFLWSRWVFFKTIIILDYSSFYGVGVYVRNFTYRAKITLYTFVMLPTEQKPHFTRSQCYLQSKNHILHVRNVTYRAKITLYMFAILPTEKKSHFTRSQFYLQGKKNHTVHVRNFTYRAKKHTLHVRNFTYRAKIALYTFAILPTVQKSHFTRSQCYLQSKHHTLHVRNFTCQHGQPALTDRPTHKIIHPLNSN